MAKAMTKGSSPFLANAKVTCSRGTLKVSPPQVHFIVNAGEFGEMGVRFNMQDKSDKRQLDLISDLLGAKDYTVSLEEKELRVIGFYTNDGPIMVAVVHPVFDIALIINGPHRTVTLTRAIREAQKTADTISVIC